mmetsp:Transcript_2689/g.7049  ORF Transcript_2689/g.7049 Transcript_2689/m.7049 type:complete len:379 (-) Transcript_2689:80-1216(-)
MAIDDGEPRNLLVKRVVFITCWYITSGITLFGNKHILNTLRTNPSTLGTFQMISTAVLGCAKMYLPRLLGGGGWKQAGNDRNGSGSGLPPVGGGGAGGGAGDGQRSPSGMSKTFIRDMMIVGILRFVTVVAGLLSLKFVAVSFTETIKSSAPFFTVIFSRAMLRERTSMAVNVSLIPVVSGLALCSATELSFNTIGFSAAVFNNCIDCVQNVFSKKLLTTQYSYVQLQFYTSAAALVVQLPLMLLTSNGLSLSSQPVEDDSTTSDDKPSGLMGSLLFHLVFNGVSFHLQSVMAYAVMSVVSPVTQSVLNTLKRALLIWLSILWFGNPVTVWSALGTVICVFGVFSYNYARQNYPPAPLRERSGSKLAVIAPEKDRRSV